MDQMDSRQARKLVASVSHWHHDFEVYKGIRTGGSYDPAFLLDKLRLPADLRGVRVIDIGPSDGFSSMHLARRGADVTSVDYRAKHEHGFGAMETITGLKFTYVQKNIYDIDPKKFGKFDMCLFLGLLYHLPDMMRAFDILSRICTGTLYLETEGEPDLMPGVAVARYYEAATLANDHTNFWAPNPECVRGMLRDAGFTPKRDETWGRRIFVEAAAPGGERPEKMRLAYGIL